MSSDAIKNLEDIQVGDWIRISKNQKQEIAQVTRTTRCQFTASHYTFWKKDGVSLKGFGYSDWKYHAYLLTPEEIKEHEEAQERVKLALELADFLRDGSKLPIETLREWTKTAKGIINEA